MIEVYNKYNKLEITFEHLEDPRAAFKKCKELKIKVKKLVRKYRDKISVYYCSKCKKRTYIDSASFIESCEHCQDVTSLYFVGFKKAEKFTEDIIYAD